MQIKAEGMEKNIRFYLTGQVIFDEGQAGNEMFIILDGEVGIYKSAQAKSQKLLTTLTTGAFFGEMALIDDKPRSATAICAKDAKVLVLNDKAFDTVVQENPEFAAKMIKNLATRLRGANKMLEEALAGNTSKVVFAGLKDYAQEKGQPTSHGLRVAVDDFAYWASQHLGIPERSVPEIIRFLVEKGFIQVSALGEAEVLVTP